MPEDERQLGHWARRLGRRGRLGVRPDGLGHREATRERLKAAGKAVRARAKSARVAGTLDIGGLPDQPRRGMALIKSQNGVVSFLPRRATGPAWVRAAWIFVPAYPTFERSNSRTRDPWCVLFDGLQITSPRCKRASGGWLCWVEATSISIGVPPLRDMPFPQRIGTCW